MRCSTYFHLLVIAVLPSVATAQQIINQPAQTDSVPIVQASSIRTPAAWEQELEFNDGILKYESGDYEGAKEHFQSAHSIAAPSSEFCDMCDAQLTIGESYFSQSTGANCCRSQCVDACSAQNSARRRWNINLVGGYQYDSNVGLSPEFIGLGAVTDKSDSAFFTAAFADFRIIEKPDFVLGAVGSIYSNYWQSQDQFNVEDYMGGLYMNKLLSQNVFAGIRYEAHRTYIDGDGLSLDHRLVPNLTFLRGDKGHTTVFYEFNPISFDEIPMIQALDRDVHVNAVGLTNAKYIMNGQGRIFVGYRFEDASAEGADFDRETHQVNGRIEVPLTDSLIVDAGFRYFWDDYDNPSSLDFDGEVRSDRRLEVRSGIQKIINRNWSARLDYTYVDSDSNVANLFDVRFFEYEKHNFSTQLIFDF